MFLLAAHIGDLLSLFRVCFSSHSCSILWECLDLGLGYSRRQKIFVWEVDLETAASVGDFLRWVADLDLVMDDGRGMQGLDLDLDLVSVAVDGGRLVCWEVEEEIWASGERFLRWEAYLELVSVAVDGGRFVCWEVEIQIWASSGRFLR